MRTHGASPGRAEFRRLARRHPLIPVAREILGDLQTPVAALQRLRSGSEAFLLESVEGGETWGRYSLLGVEPAGRLRAFGDRVELRWNGRSSRRRGDPLRILEKWLQQRSAAPLPELPRFFGGAVGAIRYEAARRLRRLPALPPLPSAAEPDVDLLLVRDVIVFDNLSHTIKLITCAEPGNGPDAAYDHALRRLDRLEDRLAKALPQSETRPCRSVKMRSETGRRMFQRSVRRAQEHIRRGDIFQVVLSHELRAPLNSEPLDVYRALRCINPSPYMFYLEFSDRSILGASPEVLVRVERDLATVRPIAGTRPRGADPEEDQRRCLALLQDEKERAEHVMLVDLGRNDLGRVCEFGTLQTSELMTVERYSHVIHLVSTVQGRLRRDQSPFDALRASFPAGTVSGAPKLKAMQIIDGLEGRRRGIYAGTVGYFGFNGTLDTCIGIRTLECVKGEARVGVGAGIVLDSSPDREWEETMSKAGAALAAIEMAERGLVP